MSADAEALRFRPAHYAALDPDKAAIVYAPTGEVTTYGQLEDRSLRLANLFDRLGLRSGDHIALLLQNVPDFLTAVWAGLRSGLYITPINWHLTPSEAAYILDDCGAQVLLSSVEVAELAQAIVPGATRLRHRLCVNGSFTGFDDLRAELAAVPAAAREHEVEGSYMLYSSGTTGQPKGILRHREIDAPFGGSTDFDRLTAGLFGFGPHTVYLCPAPLYHAAPLGWSVGTQRLGGTVVLMDHFDPVETLALIERHKVNAAQFVPTMFVRMLKLPAEARTRYDTSSLAVAVHAAAPCPVDVKEQMIDWWGPILSEYYAGSEGNGFCFIDSKAWLEHRGSVGRPVMGIVHIVDEEGNECAVGEIGTVYFEGTTPFEYHNDPAKTQSAFNDRGWSTLGDVGHVDGDGFVYLSDRRSHLIISGGVNIYPQEVENVLTMHPKVADVAVIGVPNPEMGEEVKAVVQLADPDQATAETAAELIAYCRERLAHFKCPRSVDFDPDLPRLPSGKLFKRRLIDKYRG